MVKALDNTTMTDTNNDHIIAGRTWLPWSGEVSPLPRVLEEEGGVRAGDPRLVHGALDTGAGANWVR